MPYVLASPTDIGFKGCSLGSSILKTDCSVCFNWKRSVDCGLRRGSRKVPWSTNERVPEKETKILSTDKPCSES